MRESFAFNHLHNASVLAGERQHFHARAAPPHTGEVVAISKIVPFQWRKKGGRWPMAKTYSTPSGETCKPENQIIVTRERTS